MSNNKFKVLIIEDEANICSFIQTLLETNGYQALVAQTCVMGMTMFISYNPDLVILDLGLPDRDGLDAIRSIRPQGLGRNKQMMADLVCKRQFWLLTLLYTVKNRGK